MTTLVKDAPRTEHEVAAVEVLLPIAHVHPDPFQPRIKCDAELADSIKTQGVLQAISVEPAQELDAVCEHCGNTFAELAALGHYMINDGERRWRGSLAANRNEILAKIIETTEEGDRLKRQLTSNTGKPLSPIEEAIAFQRLMEVEGWSQVELAKQLGRPRATIGDRLRLVEIHQAWLDLISSGRLQISHAPIIHQYRTVPDEYQMKAAEKIAKGEGWQMRRHKGEHDVIPVADFRRAIHEAFRDYIVKLEEVRSYKGPVLEVEEEAYSFSGSKLKKVKYAADIKLWRPIKHAAENRAKERAKKERSRYAGSSGGGYESTMSKLRKRLAKEKSEIPVRSTSEYYGEAAKGETVIFDDRGWPAEIHPKVLLEALDASKVAIVQGKHDAGRGKIVTSDAAAVEKARKAYADFVLEATRKSVAPLRSKLTDDVLAEHAVKGPGATALLKALDLTRGSPKVVASAMGLTVNGDVDQDYYEDEESAVLADATRQNAERLLSALAAVTELGLKVPDPWTLAGEVNKKLSAIEFRLPSSNGAAPGKSKTKQKREARARGEQVGDASRGAAVASA